MRASKSAILSVLVGFSITTWADSSLLRLNPQTYSGTRGGEPSSQIIGLAQTSYQDNKWTLDFHFEGETFGRRDVSLDVDRAFYHWQLDEDHFYFGRLNPYDLLDHPARRNPWGLLAANEPQNFGLQLGYGYNHGEPRPSPILMGWLGVHFETARREYVQFSASATPFFIPSMGAEVELFKDAPASVGRFARRPPQTVNLDGTQTLPLRLELDKSRTLEDVVLQPQVKVQLKVQSELDYAEFENWITVARAPSPFPSFNTQDYLIVKENSVEAYAKVTPKFEQRFTGTETLRWNIPDAPWSAALVGSLLIHSDRRWGYEIGAESDYLRISLLEERTFGSNNSTFFSSEARYFGLLGQIDVRVPWDEIIIYSGVKSHFRQSDLWSHAGVAFPLSQQASLQTGLDLFHGEASSYFGEWRTNSRIGVALNWEIGG